MLRQTIASAALTASLLAADVVLLTLYLNPETRLLRDGGGLLVSLFLPYALGATLVLLVLGVLGSLFQWWPRSLRRPIEGLPWFTTFSFAAITTTGYVFLVNLETYRDSIPYTSARALGLATGTLLLASLVLVGIGAFALALPHRRRGASGALVVLAVASALVVPLALRPAPPARTPAVPFATEAVPPLRRVTLIGIDGLDASLAREGALRGRLPALAPLLRRGTHGALRTLDPPEGPPLWTSIATGRLPREHGIKSFSSYRVLGAPSRFDLLPASAGVGLLERAGLVSTTPVTVASRRNRALWNVLNGFGIHAGVVRFWGTHPPERVQGFMLSNYFHLLRGDPRRAAAALHPRDLAAEVEARSVAPEQVDRALVARFVDLAVAVPGETFDWQRELVERALAPDLTYRRAGALLRAAYDPPFFVTYVYGLDVVGHAFLRYARPDAFGDVEAAAARRYGHVVERYAAWVSEWVAEQAAALGPGEVLLVVSAYGLEPRPAWRNLASRAIGGPAAAVVHASGTSGFLLAVGDGIRPGAVLGPASILDVAPTVLYLMGLPVARDMEGRVLTEMLDTSFAAAHPLTFIPSYESLAVTPMAGPDDDELPPLPDQEP
jgi:predicted AlkP superfamily phosphohydrolase/phosphomutase